MTAFADALGVLFFDPNIAVEIWHRDGEGQFTRAQGILRRPDEITEFGSARLLSDTTRIDVRVSDDEIAAVLAYIKSTWPERERGFQAEVTANDGDGS